MLNNILNIEGASVLPKEKQKAINGGGGCGVKVEGVWHPVPDLNGNGATIDEASDSLGTYVNFPTFAGVQVVGTVTNWCCDSCPWN
ncbi:MAG: hypothetical protein COW03_12100 [Cytophagales bacterium CG12_big_fil_rev_8_21_14_0_65_40_12]|nr:MAG: hypothetical protein COW03_12100 [Cytophagales bacterium CG12_big_fil_rev_8_21_14_0_65_40_12]PIW06011.1 MAG: hypothetical protein COW40_01655 [Cytophagales bacterium CG17_big_fil_post_rev_8_21_14_2_50_40_13]